MIELVRARQAADLERLPALGYEWDPPHPKYPQFTCAGYVKRFFAKYLRHYQAEWAGEPFILADWQWGDIIRPLFGWIRPDGTRRFREAYVEVPRKNGKTPLGAGIGLLLTAGDDEPGAQVYSAATKRDQAKIVWNDAAEMVNRSRQLNKLFGPHRKRNLHVARTASFFEPLSADSRTMDGLKPHGAIIDELHAHRDSHVYEVLTTAYGNRRQPLTVMITTAGLYDPESIGWQKHEHARKVLEGSVEDDTFFAYIACADKADDPFDEATWRKANPNYGVSVKADYLAEQAQKARQQPSFYNSFLRYHLNIWTQSVTRWLDYDVWDQCGNWQADPDELLGQVCYGGLDMANTTDLAAFVLVFPEEWKVLAWHWCPEESILKRSQADGVPYTDWVDAGILSATPGNAVDYDAVRATIVQLCEDYAVQEVWYDPWNCAQMAQQLAEQHGIETVQCRQGFASLNGPSKQFERLLYGHELRHGNNPALNWQAAHVAKKEDPAGNIKPDKKASSERIDGIVALIEAIGAATSATQGMSGMYDDEDPLVLEIG